MSLSGDFQPTVIISDSAIDPDRFLFEGVDTSPGPVYSVGETAKIFFGRSPSWLRGHESAGKFLIPGQDPVVPNRRVQNSARFFCLEDIEKIAHCLAYHGVLTGARLRIVLTILKAQAQLWNYIA